MTFSLLDVPEAACILDNAAQMIAHELRGNRTPLVPETVITEVAAAAKIYSRDASSQRIENETAVELCRAVDRLLGGPSQSNDALCELLLDFCERTSAKFPPVRH